jgi:hypothetical protein
MAWYLVKNRDNFSFALLCFWYLSEKPDLVSQQLRSYDKLNWLLLVFRISTKKWFWYRPKLSGLA